MNKIELVNVLASIKGFWGVLAQKRRRRRADPLQSFARGRQKDFRLHPSRSIILIIQIRQNQPQLFLTKNTQAFHIGFRQFSMF